MNLTLDRTQKELGSTVRRFLQVYSSPDDVSRLMETDIGFDAEIWTRMATELGLQGLVIPEEFGGSGASWVELGVVLEEMGRALLCAPFFSTVVLATTTLLEAGDAQAMEKLLPRIAEGTATATLALTEESGRWDEGGISTRAVPDGSGYLLDGQKSYVIDGASADVIIVPARTDQGVTLFVVHGDADGLTKQPLKTLDLTRKLARLDFRHVRADILGAEGEGWATLQRVLDFAAVGLGVEQVGGGEAALDMAVAYAKTRVQFGQPIGSFQAIKHKCADMFLEVESAKSAAYYALAAAAAGSQEFPAAASLTKATCSDMFSLVSHENVQIHGGMGYTWEVPAHLYFKRAKSTELYLGDSQYHRERLLQRMGA